MRHCKGCVCLCAWLAVGVLLFNCIMQRSGFQWTQALQQKQQLFQAQPVRPVPFLLSLIIFFFSLLLNSPSASSVVSLCTHSTCSTCTSNGAVDIFSLLPDVRTAQLSSAPSPHGWWLIISTNVLICVFETLLTVRYLQRRCFHILYQRKTGQRLGFNNDYSG